MNDVQRERADEVERLNRFIEGIVATLGVGVVVLDDGHAIKVWNSLATELWGLRADEVDGKSFFDLNIGLPLEQIRSPVRAALSDTDRVTVAVDAIDRRGRALRCTVRSLPLVDNGSSSYGVILLMWREDGEMGHVGTEQKSQHPQRAVLGFRFAWFSVEGTPLVPASGRIAVGCRSPVGSVHSPTKDA